MRKIFLLVVLALVVVLGTGCDALASPIKGRVKVDADVGWEPESTVAAAQSTATVATAAAAAAPTATPNASDGSAAPASSAPATTAGPLGIKYQYDAGGCEGARNAGLDEKEFPACWLQRLQSGEIVGWRNTVEEWVGRDLSAQSDVAIAVIAIQQLGQRFGAPSFEGMVLTFPNRQPAMLWCPGGASYPPDTARPLEGTAGAEWADLLVVVDAGTGGPDKVVRAKDHPCWMVYRR